jgi:hypothetical protein
MVWRSPLVGVTSPQLQHILIGMVQSHMTCTLQTVKAKAFSSLSIASIMSKQAVGAIESHYLTDTVASFDTFTVFCVEIQVKSQDHLQDVRPAINFPDSVQMTASTMVHIWQFDLGEYPNTRIPNIPRSQHVRIVSTRVQELMENECPSPSLSFIKAC